jgi:exonuclease III
LRIAQWNSNGLQQHKEEVKIFLKQNLIDILLVSKTHFTNKNYFSTPGYNLCYTCHPDETAHGGTAIIIKSSLAYCVQPKYAEATIQATTISVCGLFCDITIAAAYCLPRHNLKEEHFAAFFQTLGPRFLAGGILTASTHSGDQD